MNHVRLWGLFLLFAVVLLGQSDTAAITGYVRDPTGAVVPNATVVITNEATGVERRSTTNANGYYIISSLPAGFYTVSAEATGFKKFEKTQNKLDANIATSVDAQLQVGSASETINVIAEAVNVQSESAALGKVVTTAEVKNLPLNGRNPLFLAMLKPGVSGSNAMAQFSFNLTTGGLNINGSRTQDNLITFDGAVAVRTRSNGTSIGTADVDAVQEMQILTANYNAEYGRAAGGQIRIVTKSGQRDFHGDFYEYFRNSAMNANEWSRNRVVGREDISGRPGPFRFNQFGYALSGPVFIPKVFNKDRNKFFWLFGQEYVRFRQEQLNATNGIRVPSLAMRRGDFSELLNAPNVFYNTPRVITDPQTGNPFPNNVIPTNRLSANGLALLRAFPEPNTLIAGANNFQAATALQDQRKDTYSFDYIPAERHYFRVRVQNYNLIDQGAFRSNTDRAPSTLDRPNLTSSVNYIWTVTPTIVNEALVTASVDRVRIRVNADAPYQRSLYGINYPYLFPAKEIFDKIPTIEIQNFQQVDGGPYPSSSAGPIYVVSDNLSWIKGNHSYKFGFLFERAGQNDFDQINVQGVPGGTNNQNGRFVFNDSRPGGTGLAVANAALGLYDTYAELGNRSYTPYRGHMYEWFAQDSWKATSRLRLEYGVRWTRIQPYYSLWRNMLVFDPNRYDASRQYNIDPRTGIGTYARPIDQYNGMVIPGNGWPEAAIGRVPIASTGEFNALFGGDKSFSKTHNVWQPRLGVAYAFNDKNVLRAAVGRFVTRLGVSDSVFLGGNPPLQPSASTSNGLVDNPAGAGLVTGFPLSATTQDPIFNNPEAWTWNVTFQRELPWNTTIEAGYVGRLGLNGQRERNINQLLPGTLQANPGVNVDFLRPYRGYGPIRSTNNDA
ncbi:MAG TPA: carboxypeptidase regulatory-like domain-containing protein, partial [Bryobacteraceae bacterium]|nr:carboxypeptidase regulatory-like domain-containing protein [Bryobacteraceae bacterium]